MIRRIEEHSLSALPALQTVYDDGWVLRFANGYTRRANSVNPLYPAAVDDLTAKIERCAALYRERGLRPTFKLTDAAQPPGLDARLADMGYATDPPTSVMTLDLTAVALHDAPNFTGGRLCNDWLRAYTILNEVDTRHQATIERMLTNIALPACFARLHEDGDVLAVGLAVAGGDYVGLYDIVTRADRRRRGLGRQLVSGLLRWGQSQGAHTAYLQVMNSNTPAQSLYAGVGFTLAYRYWYRAATP